MMKIGQVIYLVPYQSMTILPARIVEERITRKIDRTNSEWFAEMILANGRREIVSLTSYRGEMFASEKIVKQSLLKRSEDAINAMVSAAVSFAKESFQDPETTKDMTETEQTN